MNGKPTLKWESPQTAYVVGRGSENGDHRPSLDGRSSGVSIAERTALEGSNNATSPNRLAGPLKSGMKKRSTYSELPLDVSNYSDSDADASRGAPPAEAVRAKSVRVSIDGASARNGGASFMGTLQNLGTRVSRASESLFGTKASGRKSRSVQQIRAWSKGLIFKAYAAKGATPLRRPTPKGTRLSDPLLCAPPDQRAVPDSHERSRQGKRGRREAGAARGDEAAQLQGGESMHTVAPSAAPTAPDRDHAALEHASCVKTCLVSPCHQVLSKVMESVPLTIITVVVTIFALFEDDIKRLVREQRARRARARE